ncbi:hypothetical protein FHS79_002549 [Polymorphobacter multimanifer]|uniref:Tip attachment protein J domain-containing protein n=1 Tax=Polymorphobacter multimanifer TaxID=1070431 RepID=A0A841L6Z2_9SPHN|nr:hypothetical protein [Polymorphobacter multimanifer]MBB6228364.1 hypothetical protein [Polymorphobacter multimanifer]
MGKILKPIAIGALIIGAVVLTGGAAVIPGLVATSTTAVVAGTTLTVAVGATAATVAVAGGIAGVLATAALSIAAGSILSGVGAIFAKTPPISGATLGRLSPSLNANVQRGTVFGTTAMHTDVLYLWFSGTDEEYVDAIVCHASHRCHAVREMYFDGKLAWTAAGGVQGEFAGYLTVAVRLEGTAANGVTFGGWSAASQKAIGLCYSHIRVKRSGNTKTTTSPLPGGLPGQMVVIGDGMPVYDPRRDSTAGGSGSHRLNDNTTWQFVDGGTVLGSNTALQALSNCRGWWKNGQRLVGGSASPARLNVASFAAAANLCDEVISLSGGGSQKRYESGAVFRDDQPVSGQLDVLMTACQGEIDDSTGRIAMRIRHNDLADVALALGPDDITGSGSYVPALKLSETFNIVRGRFVDGSATGLYQLNDYAPIVLTSPDGVERVRPADFGAVQDGRRATRLARGIAQSAQFPGIFTGIFGPRALLLRRGKIVTLTLPQLNFVAKKFRVLSQRLEMTSGDVEMQLGEEDPVIYAGDGGEEGPVVVPAPVLFDGTQYPIVPLGVEQGATRNNPRGTYNAGATYVFGDSVIFAGSTYQLIVSNSIGNAPPDVARWALVAAAGSGVPGADGLPGITIEVTNENHSVATEADGSAGSYTAAGGLMRLTRGTTVLTPVFSIAAATPATSWITIDASTGVYTVTDPGVTQATATLRAAWAGLNYDRTYTLSKTLRGVEGPNLQLSASSQGFIFLDNVATPGSQTITLTAALTNLSGTATFSASPSVTVAGSGNSRTLAIGDFGANRQVTVEATLSGITDRITIVRLDRSTADAGANLVAAANSNRVPFSRMERKTEGWGVLFNPFSLAFTEGDGDFENRRFYAAFVTATASAQLISIGSTTAGEMRVSALERLSVSGRVDAFGFVSSWLFRAVIRLADGSFAFETIAFGSGAIGAATLTTGFIVMPATAVAMRLELLAITSGAGAMTLAISEPMVTSAVTGQALHPPFTAGPNAQSGATVGAPAGTMVGGQEAAALVADAATAKADATTALVALGDIASDGMFSVPEKLQVRTLRDAIEIEYPVLLARAATFGVSSSAYTSAYNALISYLASVAIDTNVKTSISRSAFAAAFAAYFDARDDMADANVAVASQRATWATVSGTGRPADNADVTAANAPVAVPAATQVIRTDSAFTALAGQLPREAQFRLRVGGVDVTTSAAWSSVSYSNTATIGGSTGLLTITAISGDGRVDVQAVYAGVTYPATMGVIRQREAPPTSGGGGSGSAGSASGTISFLTSSTSYGSPALDLTVTAGSGGSVALAAAASYTSGTPGVVLGAAGKWQWRIVGGTFADVTGGEGFHSVSADDVEFGIIEVNRTQSGLTAGGNYQFQFLLRSGFGGVTASFGGGGSAVAS